jgi:hypothetical protein
VEVTHVETTHGPVAVGGHTITLVARTSAVTVGSGPSGVIGSRTRPRHVEILDADGGRVTVRVRDYQRIATIVIASAAAVGVTTSLFNRLVRSAS